MARELYGFLLDVPEGPLLEGEVGDDAFVARVTVDVLDDGSLYSVLATEPAFGAIEQHLIRMNRDSWTHLRALCDAAIEAMDRRT
jgi:hypothetical protein